jgi:hypothetical protein
VEIEVLKASGKVRALSFGGGGLHGPARITARVRDGDVDAQVDIAFVKTEGRYVVQAVRGANLTSEILHAVRPPEIIREAVLDLIFGSLEGRRPGTKEWGRAVAGRFIGARLRGEPAPQSPDLNDAPKVKEVAWVYQFAYMVGQRPTATVMKGFGLPRSTAGRLIRQARDQGLLGQTTERKAGV